MAQSENRLGRLIAYHRERQNLTKAELARRSGVSPPYLSQIESGDRSPSEAVLRRIAGALGVMNIDLLEAAGMLSYADETLAYKIDRKLYDITEIVRRHNEDEAYVLHDILTTHIQDLIRFYGSGPAQPVGPERWDELSARDQKLAQRLITRLADSAVDDSDEDEEPET